MGTKSSRGSSKSTTSSEHAVEIDLSIHFANSKTCKTWYKVKDCFTGISKNVPKVLGVEESTILSRRKSNNRGKSGSFPGPSQVANTKPQQKHDAKSRSFPAVYSVPKGEKVDRHNTKPGSSLLEDWLKISHQARMNRFEC